MSKKVKRTISLFIAALMLLSTMTVLAFAESCPKTYAEATDKEVGPHDHVAAVDANGVVVKTEDTSKYVEPTCAKTGKKEYYVKCAVCGKEISGTREIVYLPKLKSHVEGSKTIQDVVEPTCAEYGSYKVVTRCKICNEIISVKLVAVEKTTAHVAGTPRKENIVNATCAKKGSYDSVIYCKICGKELQRTFKEVPKLDYHVSEYSLDRIVYLGAGKDKGKLIVEFIQIDPNGSEMEIDRVGRTVRYNPSTVYSYVDTGVANVKLVENGDIIIIEKVGTVLGEDVYRARRAVKLPGEPLKKPDNGGAIGLFYADTYAANGYCETRTCADGEERCAVCGELLNPAIPHVWDKGVETKAATLTTQGEITYRCLIDGCFGTKIENTPVLTAKRGDVDKDGKVTTADARYVLRFAVGLGNFDKVISTCTSDDSFKAADYDKSGKIEAADARLVLRTAVGLRN